MFIWRENVRSLSQVMYVCTSSFISTWGLKSLFCMRDKYKEISAMQMMIPQQKQVLNWYDETYIQQLTRKMGNVY